MNHLQRIMGNFKKLRGNIKTKQQGKPENTLVVIRHGSTALNSEDRIRAWTDAPLSDQGVKEVNDTIPTIKKQKLDGLITSDLQRAKHTAEIISKGTGVPILEETQGLRPWQLGVFTGMPVKETLKTIQDYIKNRPNEPVPHGESFNQFKERFIRTVQRIQQQFPNDKIGIVTHHRGERLMKAWMDAGKPDDILKIKPDAFMQKGVEPAGSISHEVPPPEPSSKVM